MFNETEKKYISHQHHWFAMSMNEGWATQFHRVHITSEMSGWIWRWVHLSYEYLPSFLSILSINSSVSITGTCIHIRKSDTFRILNPLPERLGQVQWAHQLSMTSQQSSLHVGKSQWVCGSMILEQQEWDTDLKSLASLLTHRPPGISVAFNRVQGISLFSFPCRDHQEGLATCHLAPCLLAGHLECDTGSSGLHTEWLSDPCDWCLTWAPRLGPQLCKGTLGHLPSSLGRDI